jgi:hypothetical protein
MDNEIAYRISGQSGETCLSPITICLLILAIVYVFISRNKSIILLLVSLSIFIPQTQKIVIGGIDFPNLRIICLIGWLSVLLGNKRKINILKLDKLIILWAIVNFISYVLLWQSISAIIFKGAFLFDTIGLYFLFRYYITSSEDILAITKLLIILSVIISFFMLFEQHTHRNLFSIFGLPEFSELRNGRLRAQGPFRHAILAGVYGATTFPYIFILFWSEKRNRIFFYFGIISSLMIVVASSSSTPLISLLAATLAIMLWPLHNQMSVIRKLLVITLIILHFSMKAPVWALISRIDFTSGNSSYHRYLLVDGFIRHISDWFLIGTKTTQTWAADFLDMQDVSNRFVTEGINGGLIGFILFIAIIVTCFKMVGTKVRETEDPGLRKCIWALGAAVFTHITAFFGINYFDQTTILWYLLLAFIASLEKNPIEEANVAAA